ncbi:hypothetical protein WK55_09755 [Burkholderia ubonensis]|uniref:hypothetical protein n=1 Tax=Burkholderia ubonensis TaxID=101571 RepID=UPI0007571158|nr:hypothetical protein [Burkholderia ubonensis]KVT60620.1 hypothetical protein WK55_09755 [Burkholderia ubonensis]
MNYACPFCAKINDRHMGLTCHVEPEDGDVSICVGCGQLAVFDLVNAHMRVPTDDESHVFARDADIQQYLEVWRTAVRKTPH